MSVKIGVLTLLENPRIKAAADEIYEECLDSFTYGDLARYYSELYGIRHFLEAWKTFDSEDRSDHVWWMLNENLKGFSQPSCRLPIFWLALAKRLVLLNHVPRNVANFVLEFFCSLDVNRFAIAGRLNSHQRIGFLDDIDEVVRAIEAMKDEGRLGPDIRDVDWGISDQ
ncbi:hypothetical protein [Roseateles sp.]|uniref:hypothetical protein n=1 Tax=Roseateles sp. TaxID=1971397 RepID=UPI0031DDFE42